MAKFLFVVPPMSGHINPTLGLGTELIGRGHHVAWLSFDPRLQQRIPDKGTFILLPSDISLEQKEKIEQELLEIGKKAVYGLESLKFLYDEVLIPMNQAMLNGIEIAIRDYNPDIVINDHQVFAAAVASLKENIPYVTSVTAPAAIKVNEALPKIYEWEGEQVIAFQKYNGIYSEQRLDCSNLLSLVYTSSEFFGESNLPAYYEFVGPVINRTEHIGKFDWEWLSNQTERSKILVSIGTTFDHTQKKTFFSKVVEALSDENIAVIVISDPALFDSVPANFLVCKYVPQLELIPHLDAVVCHGGHNTVCEALSNGKPLVVLPIAYDQSYVAGCVVNSGVGIRLNFNRFKADHLRSAINNILTDTAYRSNAHKIQDSFKRSGGVARAADLLENLLNTKKQQ